MLKVGQIKEMTARGTYPDRDGLYLVVSKSGAQSWIYRFQLVGRRREMGLGNVKQVSLGEARELAGEARKLHKAGTDPIAARNEAKKASTPKRDVWTFQDCVDAYIAVKENDWSNAKHAAQWRNTLTRYAGPVIGDLPVAEVTVDHIEEILLPIWSTKNETASRVRGRIESVLNWASAKKHRDRNIPNPAVWRGNMEVILSKRHTAEHHPAMAYTDVPSLMAALREKETVGSAALQFTILTAGRTSEILEATWSEIDLKTATWTVPAERMKLRKEHRVPLSVPAVALLKSLDVQGDLIFPGNKHKRPLSNATMSKVLRNAQPAKLTVHGMRSSFRDWCAEATNFPEIVAEKSLAHGEKSATVAAYRRADMLEKRRLLMDAWANYIVANSNVITLPVKREVSV
jgi:integrase